MNILAQKNMKKEKFPSYFGFQIRPTFPTRFIGEPNLTLKQNEFETTIAQKMGFSVGATVRAGVTKLIAIETGINFTQRNFDLTMDVADSNIHAENTMRFIEYDIPVNALFYIQLSRKFYMNASLGVNICYKPTNVGVLTLPGGSDSFKHTGIVNRKTGFGVNANIGFEYRTEKAGIFYIGGSGRVPFSQLFDIVAQYENQGHENKIIGKIDGSFLAIDFKYFLPQIKNKGVQFQPGPITQ